ncbi:hypothetical protein MASR2M15_27300 [Anaerolineales bacterium]
MDHKRIKETRLWMRQFLQYIAAVHEALGVERQMINMTLLASHPVCDDQRLNYVVPRDNMALIPAQQIPPVMAQLENREREPWFWFLEDLFPSVFQQHLESNGLVPFVSHQLWIWNAALAAESVAASRVSQALEPVEGQRYWQSLSPDRYEICLQMLEPIWFKAPQSQVMNYTCEDWLNQNEPGDSILLRLSVLDDVVHIIALGYPKHKKLDAIVLINFLQGLRQRGIHTIYFSGLALKIQSIAQQTGFEKVTNLLAYCLKPDAALPIKELKTYEQLDQSFLIL